MSFTSFCIFYVYFNSEVPDKRSDVRLSGTSILKKVKKAKTNTYYKGLTEFR